MFDRQGVKKNERNPRARANTQLHPGAKAAATGDGDSTHASLAPTFDLANIKEVRAHSTFDLANIEVRAHAYRRSYPRTYMFVSRSNIPC